MTKLVVTGGRDYADTAAAYAALKRVDDTLGFTTLIHGGAQGADRICADIAARMGKDIETYRARWDLYGKRAGFLRNEEMITQGKPDLALVFPGGKGTAHMHGLLVKYHVPLKVIT